jgi:NAD(P)-dependent dehydrogenase (short-subunit alcohol dehydrogenase family)
VTARVALVTGCGKPDGMGRAIARTLAASGASVVVADVKPSGVLNRRQEVAGGPADARRQHITARQSFIPEGEGR